MTLGMVAPLLLAAAPRPRVTLLTALPLVWGEGGPEAMLRGEAEPGPALQRLRAKFVIEPLDVLSARTLGDGVALIAQPRRLAPAELVALDAFVRRGGHALILADPQLDWPSDYPLGDPRRPPPVTLLDPLFAHWGLKLTATGDGRGQWSGSETCLEIAEDAVDCRIGKGRAMLIGDADLLARDEGVRRVEAALAGLAGEHSSRVVGSAWTAAAIVAGVAALLFYLKHKGAKERT